MPNMKALSHRIKKVIANVKVFQNESPIFYNKKLWPLQKGLQK